ncbi:transposase [Nocardia niigatensis]
MLRQLVAARWPAAGLPVICDNCSVHKPREVREWFAANDIELVFYPAYSSWMNRIACGFTSFRAFR